MWFKIVKEAEFQSGSWSDNFARVLSFFES
jgi:hypothetical protein